jgi:hypothetical protein
MHENDAPGTECRSARLPLRCLPPLFSSHLDRGLKRVQVGSSKYPSSLTTGENSRGSGRFRCMTGGSFGLLRRNNLPPTLALGAQTTSQSKAFPLANLRVARAAVAAVRSDQWEPVGTGGNWSRCFFTSPSVVPVLPCCPCLLHPVFPGREFTEAPRLPPLPHCANTRSPTCR